MLLLPEEDGVLKEAADSSESAGGWCLERVSQAGERVTKPGLNRVIENALGSSPESRLHEALGPCVL